MTDSGQCVAHGWITHFYTIFSLCRINGSLSARIDWEAIYGKNVTIKNTIVSYIPSPKMSKSYDLIFPLFCRCWQRSRCSYIQEYVLIPEIGVHILKSNFCNEVSINKNSLNAVCWLTLNSTPLNLNRLFHVRSKVKRSARPILVITGVSWHCHQVALLKQDTLLYCIDYILANVK